MICKNCGAEISGKFCTKCGALVLGQSSNKNYDISGLERNIAENYTPGDMKLVHPDGQNPQNANLGFNENELVQFPVDRYSQQGNDMQNNMQNSNPSFEYNRPDVINSRVENLKGFRNEIPGSDGANFGRQSGYPQNNGYAGEQFANAQNMSKPPKKPMSGGKIALIIISIILGLILIVSLIVGAIISSITKSVKNVAKKSVKITSAITSEIQENNDKDENSKITQNEKYSSSDYYYVTE